MGKQALQEAVAQFGHHPNPAIDFCCEVESLLGEIENHRIGFKNGTPSREEISARIERAYDFRVGGDENAVKAKLLLRDTVRDVWNKLPPTQVTPWKFTPGPWSAGKPFYHRGERQKVTPIEAHDRDRVGGTWLVAWCHHNAVPSKEVAPNSRLIAAAPQLYEAGESLLSIVEAAIAAGDWKVDGACDPDADIASMRAALAKAVQP